MLRTHLILIALAGALFLTTGGRVAAADPPAAESWLWVYAPCNFQVNEQVDRLHELLRRAKKAGYNGALVTDSKFGRISDRPDHYYDNLRRTKKLANEIGMEIIPMAGNFGYSNDLLQNDPNLAEGIAVRDSVFVVKDAKATLADTANLLPGGDFEQFKNNAPAGWDFADGPGQSSFADADVKHGGKTSLRFENFTKGNESGNARVSKKVAVKPWQQYHLSAWVRTKDLSPAGEVHATVLGAKGRSLNFTSLGVKATQEWTQHHVTFNSQDNEQLGVYLGIWGGKGGTFWLDDVELRPCAGVDLLRREGCPVKVTSEDGKAEFTEGKDFKKWEYAKMGRVPWPGGYEPYHPEPPLVLTDGSRIKEGDRLKVSYYHAHVVYDESVCCCLRHDDVFRYFEDTVKQLDTYFKPKKFFMVHDEIRVAGQCGLCKQEGVTAGGVLAENARRCVKIIHQVSPDAQVFDWSDTFDPYHNAHDNYYLVGSTLEKSWEGLDKAVVVANWNHGKAAESLKFFAEQGHAQIIAGYYDAGDVQGELEGWFKAAKGVKGVQGFIYVTWQNNYKDLEKFAEEVKKHKDG
jgi:Carbohydrate binding domain